MKVGDLIEVYQYVARYEAGVVPTGKIDSGVVLDVYGMNGEEKLFSYISQKSGRVCFREINEDSTGISTVVSVISKI